jgi:hypothetical protein
MTPDYFDPHNHAPEVSPDDEWGDAEALEGAAGVGLPAARWLPEPRILPNERKGAKISLKIEPHVAELTEKDGSGRLEINEFGSRVVRLTAVPDAPLPVPKQVIPPLEAATPGDHAAAASRAWGDGSARGRPWYAGAVGVLAVVVMGLIVVFSRAGGRGEASPAKSVIPPAAEPPVPATAGWVPVMGECGDEARGILIRYARATTADEVLPLIRDPDKLAARVAVDWRAWNVPLDWRPPEPLAWSLGGDAGREFGVIDGSLPNGEPFRVYFVRTGDGRLLLDWEASTGKGEASFSDLVAGRIGGRTRARAQAADFHTEALPADDYHCFKLISPYSHHAIWAYAPRGGSAGELLAGLFTTGGEAPERAVTVRLECPPPGGMPQQWVIAELAHLEWVAPD